MRTAEDEKLIEILAEIYDNDEGYMAGVFYDCYNAEGRKKLLEYITKTGDKAPGMIILKAMDFGDEAKKNERVNSN